MSAVTSATFQPLGYVALLSNDNKRVILPTAAAEQSQLLRTLLQGVNAMQLLVRYNAPASLTTDPAASVAPSCEAGTSSFHSAVSRPAAAPPHADPPPPPPPQTLLQRCRTRGPEEDTTPPEPPLTTRHAACSLCAATNGEEEEEEGVLHAEPSQGGAQAAACAPPRAASAENEEHTHEEEEEGESRLKGDAEETTIGETESVHKATTESMYITLGVPYVCGELVRPFSSINARTASLAAAQGGEEEEEQQSHVLLDIPLQYLPFHSLIWVAQYAMVKSMHRSPEAHATQIDEFFQDIDSPMSATHIIDLLLAADLLII